MIAQKKQLCWEDVRDGEDIPSVTLNLTIQRLVMSAGSNQDFATHHHNTAMGQADGAPNMHANADSCLAMWERAITDWIGAAGRIKKVSFRIVTFNAAGDAVTVSGNVAKKWQEEGLNLVELNMKSEHARGASMQGTAIVALPSRSKPNLVPRWKA
ncbi:MAG: acyl dehydratase [Dehalococcoidia bacterium]|nr:acyl dehydratase [Dehalococcoidia bacterium]